MERSAEMKFILEFATVLSAAPQEVWAHATRMKGVNAELGPWIRMTYPAGPDLSPRPLSDPGEFLFHSWLLLFGVLPIDRHALALRSMNPPHSFHERSHSWLQRQWVHIRRIDPVGRGCRVTDHLEVVPRLDVATPVTRWIVAGLFRWRHRRLAQRFGGETTRES
jgi:hypothetical protein